MAVITKSVKLFKDRPAIIYKTQRNIQPRVFLHTHTHAHAGARAQKLTRVCGNPLCVTIYTCVRSEQDPSNNPNFNPGKELYLSLLFEIFVRPGTIVLYAVAWYVFEIINKSTYWRIPHRSNNLLFFFIFIVIPIVSLRFQITLHVGIFSSDDKNLIKLYSCARVTVSIIIRLSFC